MQEENTTPEHLNKERCDNSAQPNQQEESNTTQENAQEVSNQPENAEQTQASKAEDELSQLKKKYEELNDRYLRLVAEYDNFRKRSARERDEIYPNATAAAVGKFLPVLDNFERATEFAKEDDEMSRGLEMIHQSFRDALASLGVEAVGEVGDTFDPQLHNAVMHIEDPELGENVIAQVLQKGYKIGERVIRYAMVQTAN